MGILSFKGVSYKRMGRTWLCISKWTIFFSHNIDLLNETVTVVRNKTRWCNNSREVLFLKYIPAEKSIIDSSRSHNLRSLDTSEALTWWIPFICCWPNNPLHAGKNLCSLTEVIKLSPRFPLARQGVLPFYLIGWYTGFQSKHFTGTQGRETCPWQGCHHVKNERGGFSLWRNNEVSSAPQKWRPPWETQVKQALT